MSRWASTTTASAARWSWVRHSWAGVPTRSASSSMRSACTRRIARRNGSPRIRPEMPRHSDHPVLLGGELHLPEGFDQCLRGLACDQLRHGRSVRVPCDTYEGSVAAAPHRARSDAARGQTSAQLPMSVPARWTSMPISCGTRGRRRVPDVAGDLAGCLTRGHFVARRDRRRYHTRRSSPRVRRRRARVRRAERRGGRATGARSRQT